MSIDTIPDNLRPSAIKYETHGHNSIIDISVFKFYVY